MTLAVPIGGRLSLPAGSLLNRQHGQEAANDQCGAGCTAGSHPLQQAAGLDRETALLAKGTLIHSGQKGTPTHWNG